MTNINRLLRATLETLAPAAHAKKIVLTTRPLGQDVYATLDVPRILHVLDTLVGMAITLTANGGRVRLAAARAGSEIRFAVTDSGAGGPVNTFYFSVPQAAAMGVN